MVLDRRLILVEFFNITVCVLIPGKLLPLEASAWCASGRRQEGGQGAEIDQERGASGQHWIFEYRRKSGGH